jgi:ABC-type transporter Mla subunit MlaD
MSVLTMVTRALGDTVRFNPARRTRGRRGAKAGLADARPQRPVQVDTRRRSEDEVAGAIEPALRPKNRQQVIAELQKSYKEVTDLVKKVNLHLDEQDKRSRRMLEIAERLPRALDQVPTLSDNTTQMVETLGEMAKADRIARERTDAAIESHGRALDSIGERLASGEDTERRVAGALGDLNTTIGHMTGATDQLGVAIRSVQERDVRRDEELRRLIGRTQQWMFVAVGLCAASIVISVIIAMTA